VLRYGAGTAPIAAKTDFILALNRPLTVHRLKRPFKSVPTTEGDVYHSQNMQVFCAESVWQQLQIPGSETTGTVFLRRLPVMYGLAVKILSRAISLILSAMVTYKTVILPCRATMQCSRTNSFAWATYNKCLRTTDCNLMCSLKQENHTAPFMLSWGEPERAPHRRVCCKFSIYIYICRTSCRKSLPVLILHL